MSMRLAPPLLGACLVFALAMCSAQAADLGRQNYIQHCAGCHGMDGSGSPANGVPSMKGRVAHFLRLPEGRAFLVQVPGTSQSPLPDRDVAELLNWILQSMSAAEVPPEFQPYTTDEVRRLRAERLADVMGTRARLVQQLRERGYSID